VTAPIPDRVFSAVLTGVWWAWLYVTDMARTLRRTDRRNR
jgi:hypothetical protein